MQVKSSLEQLSKPISGAEEPAAPPGLTEGHPPPLGASDRTPIPCPASTRGCPCPKPRFPGASLPLPSHSGAPRGRPRGSEHPTRTRECGCPQRGGTGRRLPFWLISAWVGISTGMTPSRALFQSPHLLFPISSTFSCINITSKRCLFTAGINLHLLGESLSEFLPAFPLRGFGCPVIYAFSPLARGWLLPCLELLRAGGSGAWRPGGGVEPRTAARVMRRVEPGLP